MVKISLSLCHSVVLESALVLHIIQYQKARRILHFTHNLS